MYRGFGRENLRGRNRLEDLIIDRKIILKWIFKSRMREWTGFIWLWIGTGGGRGSCKRGNEPLGSIKSVQFLDQLLTCEILMKNSDSWR
jgi:hypothetical protein